MSDPWATFAKVQRTHSIRPKGVMTPELAEHLKELADKRQTELHAKRMGEQAARLAKQGPPIDRAEMYRLAARKHKGRHGWWPAPSDLPHLQRVTPI